VGGSGSLMRRCAVAAGLNGTAGAIAIGGGAAAVAAGSPTVPSGFSISTLAAGGSLSKPDDITQLGNHLFVSFQNGVGAKGEQLPAAAGQAPCRSSRWPVRRSPGGP